MPRLRSNDLCVEGEPGTGKTVLAIEIAKSLWRRCSNGT